MYISAFFLSISCRSHSLEPKQNGWYMIAYYHGLTFLSLKQPDEALKAFEHYNERSLSHAVPRRNQLEITNHKGLAAILSHNLEVYASCLKDGITGAIELQSNKRLDEVLKMFQKYVPESWKDTKQIREITEQYPLLLREIK